MRNLLTIFEYVCQLTSFAFWSLSNFAKHLDVPVDV